MQPMIVHMLVHILIHIVELRLVRRDISVLWQINVVQSHGKIVQRLQLNEAIIEPYSFQNQ